jgi:DMSO/TMAO reductase YedYZ molybdopterin-dependent catalytic subunit
LKSRPDAPKLPWPVAAGIGVVGIGAALAAGQLAAAFVGTNSSPYIAVGDAFIDRTPAALKEFAVRSFGEHDKTALLVGMGVILLLFGVVAGLLSRRTATPGTLLAIGLGILAMAAVLGRNDLGQLSVLAPVFSLVAGALVFRLLHRLALEWVTGQDADGTYEESPAGGRRKFLIGSAGVVAGAGLAGIVGQVLIDNDNVEASRAAVGPLVADKPAVVPPGADFASSGTPTYLTDAANFYRVDTALTVPQVSTQGWSLRIHGMVKREKTFSYADIRNRKLVEQIVTLCCVSNPVGGPYISNARFIGVYMKDLLNEVGVHPDADQLLSTSTDNYTAGTPIDALMDGRGAMLAIGMNGQPLPVEHGFPARMVVPGLYGYVSATKWVVDMELTTFSAQQGYWIPRGYSQQAPVKTESRIDKPASFARVPAGNVVVAGIAWAQTKGIARVEVRVDGGPWQDAQLATEVTKNSWRMWRTFFDLKPGNHTVESRATDDTGYVQTQTPADTIPNGASGWPSVAFTTA